MGLEKIVEKSKSAVKGVKDYFIVPKKAESMAKYALDHYLDSQTKETIFGDKTEEEKKLLYTGLRDKMQIKLMDYMTSLDNMSFKLSKSAGLAALVSDTFHMVDITPFDRFGSYLGAVLAVKAIAEMPKMYKYMVKSGDFYGLMEWAGMKAVAWFLPVIGPMADLNSAQRIIKKGIIKQGLNDFLSDQGITKEPLYKRIYERVKKIAGPVFTPAYSKL